MLIYEWLGIQVRWQSVSGRCRNQSRPNLSLAIPPLPSVPWIFYRCHPLIRPARRGVDGCGVGKESIHGRKESGWWWFRGVRRGQGGGFCGPGIKAYPPMINNNTQCKTNNVQHNTKFSKHKQHQKKKIKTKPNTWAFAFPKNCAIIQVGFLCVSDSF